LAANLAFKGVSLGITYFVFDAQVNSTATNNNQNPLPTRAELTAFVDRNKSIYLRPDYSEDLAKSNILAGKSPNGEELGKWISYRESDGIQFNRYTRFDSNKGIFTTFEISGDPNQGNWT
jgi:hypothetical protein